MVRNPNSSAADGAGRIRIPASTLVLMAVTGVLIAVVGWSILHDSSAQSTAPKDQVTSTPPTPAAAAPTAPAFAKLQGSWTRPDGGYVIEVRSVDADGKMDARYLNPSPINVSKAEAAVAGGTLRMFIELRDANYPGSTYDLVYDPQSDQLKGIYFQAVQQQRFEVSFVRAR